MVQGFNLSMILPNIYFQVKPLYFFTRVDLALVLFVCFVGFMSQCDCHMTFFLAFTGGGRLLTSGDPQNSISGMRKHLI